MTRGRRFLKGLDQEIREHIDRETRENIERGMPPEEARYTALRKFGNIARVQEQTREVWSRVWCEQLLQDVRYGFRMLRRNPGFTLVVILTLALGIGMNTAVFSVVNTVLLRPLAYPNPERLVWLADYDPNLKRDVVVLSEFYEWRARAQSYTAMAAYGYQQVAMETSKEAIQVSGVAIAGDFWTITGARPALGRLFGPEEQDAAVLSWDLFERQFAADPRVVGASVSLDGRPVTVTGVLPKSFRFQFPRWWLATQPQPVEAYVPLPPYAPKLFRTANVVAALKPGVPIGQALAELHVLDRTIRQESRGQPSRMPMTSLGIQPLQEKLVGDVRPALLVLLAAGAFVLLIASVNIANLLLARATVRQREIAIRAAVGAGRPRVIRQLLVESLVLALLGGAVGIVFAQSAIAILVRLSPHAVPRLTETAIDGWVLAFTLAVSIGSGILFGAGPAVALWRTNLRDALKDGSRTSSGASGPRIRRLLVAGELALAAVLLCGAGLMLKSFWRMNAHPSGFAPETVLVMKVRLAGSQYGERPAQEAYMRELLQRMESAPGVQAAGISNWFLFSGAPPFPNDTSPDRTHVIRLNAASTGYLKAVGMRLVKGRWLTETDSAASVLLNESMARQAFGSVDPIGRRISIPEAVTVVGVVSDLKYSKLDAEPPPEVYVRYQQMPYLRGADIAVRAAGDPSALAPAIRKLISEIDPAQPVYDVKTLDQALADSIAPRSFNLFLLGTFAAAALLLAVVGIYGVIAYSAAERTREIGMRMALGARRNQVVRMVVLDGMAIALAGILAGLAAALGLTRLMANLLYEVKANDPSTFAAVATTLAATALLACCIPAVKAALVDPIIALRHE
ncbi:MAG: ABC transporter permease [Bryobacteraceae bacterium]